MEFIGIVLVCILLFVFVKAAISTIKGQKGIFAHQSMDEASDWLRSNGIDESKVHFAVYRDANLARNRGAAILVGTGPGKDGEPRGFALEVKPGQGVVSSELLEPWGTATHHATAARIAKAKGERLLDLLFEQARTHRSEHPRFSNDQTEDDNNMNDEFAFSPSMPHMIGLDPVSAFFNEGHAYLVYENCISVTEKAAGKAMPIRYPYVMVVMNAETKRQLMLVTLEYNTHTNTYALCTFLPDGTHVYNEDGQHLKALEDFVHKALKVSSAELHL